MGRDNRDWMWTFTKNMDHRSVEACYADAFNILQRSCFRHKSSAKLIYGTIGIEQGEVNHRMHLQGYLLFDLPVSDYSVKALYGVGVKAPYCKPSLYDAFTNTRYCQKQDQCVTFGSVLRAQELSTMHLARYGKEKLDNLRKVRRIEDGPLGDRGGAMGEAH